MTGVAGIAVVLITGYALVVLRKFCWIIVLVTGNTTKCLVVTGSGMALGALIPLVFVFPTINGEVHVVVVKSRRFPSCLVVTSLTSSWELCRLVVRIIG